MKIVINKCYGGFGLSEKAKLRHNNESSMADELDSNIQRDDPILVQIVEEMGMDAWGEWAKLKVVEIPDGVDYRINENKGMESIHEVHRAWE